MGELFGGGYRWGGLGRRGKSARAFVLGPWRWDAASCSLRVDGSGAVGDRLGGGCGRDFPAFAVGFGDEAVGLGKVGEVECGCVPLEGFLREAGCDIAKRNGFAERAGVMEAVAGLLAFSGGVDPDVPMAEFGFFRERAGGELLDRVEFRHADVREDEGAFFADEERT